MILHGVVPVGRVVLGRHCKKIAIYCQNSMSELWLAISEFQQPGFAPDLGCLRTRSTRGRGLGTQSDCHRAHVSSLFFFQNIGLDFIPTRVTSDDRTSSHAVNFALDAFWEVSFDLLVSPVKSPTRRDDYADVSVTDCFDE